MAGSATVPHTFGSDSGNVRLSDWDDDFNAILAYLNDPTNRISFGVDSGVANAYVLTPNPAIPNYTNPFIVWFVPGHSNTTTSTANINGKGGLAISKDSPAGPAPLSGGEIIAGNLCGLMLDPNLNGGAGGFHLLNPQGSTGAALRGYLSGCTLTNDGVAPNTKIDVSAGQVTDDTNASLLTFGSGTIDFTTNGAGGLDTGVLANNAWYHCFGIAQPNGVTNYFASTSLTPTLPGTFTLKRRLGSVKTDGSAHILAFTQLGDYFLWKVLASDILSVAESTTPASVTLSVPPGVNVLAKVGVFHSPTVTSSRFWAYSPSITDAAASTDGHAVVATPATAGTSNGLTTEIWTNTSSQIRVVSDVSSGTYSIGTIGWMDYRGRFN